MIDPKKIFYNEEYEKSLVGCLILDNSLIDIIQGRITEEAFYTAKYKLLFKTVLEDYSLNGNCNIISLKDRLKNFDVMQLASLTDIASSANWEFYADKIKQYYIARRLQRTLSEKLDILNADNTVDILQDLDSSLTSYMNYENGKSTTQDLMPQLVDMMQKNMSNTSPYLGINTGWDNLSDILDGIQLGKLYTIGARPSVGKSAFAVQLARNLCKEKYTVGIFSLEMSALSIATRLAALESGIQIPYIQHGWVAHSPNNLMKLNTAMERIYEYNMSIFDSDITDEKELISRIRVEAKTKGAKVFIIDHLGLLPCSNQNIKRHEQVGVITKKLHHLSQELNIAIIVLCQVNRAGEGKQPTLSELKDSGTIEENSDIVMFIHRERATGNEIEIPTDIIVVKNRDGKCGTAKMNFIPALTKFTEVKEDEYAV